MTTELFKIMLHHEVLPILDQLEKLNAPKESFFSLVQKPPFTIDEFLNEIIFECIHRSRTQNLPKASIKKHVTESGAEYTGDIKSQKTRTMNKARNYRKERAELLQARYNISPEGLALPDMTGKNRRAGYDLTSNQYKQTQNMEQLTILNKITTRQICDAKHYSRKNVEADLEAYDAHFQTVFSHCDTPEDYIDASIELFDIESHYYIEFIYALSCFLAEKDYPADELVPVIYHLCNAPLNLGLKTDSRFVISRLKLIPAIFDESWDPVSTKVELYSFIKISLFHNVPFGYEEERLTPWVNKKKGLEEQADFLKTDYNLQGMIQRKVFSHKQLQRFRQIYDSILKKR